MARGLDKHRERVQAVNALGRALARRSKSKCELCGAGETRLSSYEIPPLLDEPELDRIISVCETCLQGIDGSLSDLHRWQWVQEAIWSELPAIQVVAVRLCQRLSQQGLDWARESLDTLFLTPEIEQWINDRG